MAIKSKKTAFNKNSSASFFSQTKNKQFLPSKEDPNSGVYVNVPGKQIKFALISVYDKTGIVDFAKIISKAGYNILSSGGTLKVLEESGIQVFPVSEFTGNPEIFEGRMKTISFEIEGGILYDRQKKDQVNEAFEHGILPIDLVVCNLYPFEASPSVENIDVGGPTMLRAAAKNYENVLVVCDPADYEEVASVIASNSEAISKNGFPTREALGNDRLTELRTRLAQKTFEHLSFYDSQIAQYFRYKIQETRDKEEQTKGFPDELTIPGRKAQNLRWGDNPQQQAALYTRPGEYSPFTDLKKITGRDLSGTNVTDLSVGMENARLFKDPVAVIIKHNTPCGIALGFSVSEALERAIESDPESAFGGVIVLNQPIDFEAMKVIASFKDETSSVFDIVAAPGVSEDAIKLAPQIRKTMGVYTFAPLKPPSKDDISFKEVVGGFMLQTADWDFESNFKNWQVVTRKKPTNQQMEQMKLAWTMIRRIRSNAVIVVDKKLPMTRGIGTGQTSRFRAAKIALELAGEKHTKDAILASDAFFPFDDSVKIAAEYGISCVVQQGGSIRDEDSIKAADEAGLVMIFTNERTFWHY